MEPVEILDKLKSALAAVKADGQRTVAITSLEQFIGELRAGASSSFEARKLEYQRVLAQYDAQTKHDIEMFKSVLESGREALNALVLINGGAVVALLGFMGATISKAMPNSLGLHLTLPLLQFGGGVLLGALAFGVRYLAQASFSAGHRKTGRTINVVAVLLALTGYCLFGAGVFGAYEAFVGQFGGLAGP